MGRSTKYKPEYCQQLIDFFDAEPYEDVELPHYNDKGTVVWTDFKRTANRLPTLRNFAKLIGVHVANVYRWADRHKEFRDAFTRAKELRKWFLIENGLNGCYNPAFAKFVACNITDMADKKEHEHTGEVGLRLLTWLERIDGSGRRSPIEQIRPNAGRPILATEPPISSN